MFVHEREAVCANGLHGFSLSYSHRAAAVRIPTQNAARSERIAQGGLAKRKERPALTDDAPSIHVSEKVRLPAAYIDATLDTGCEMNTLASRRLARGTLAVVATVTPSTDAECASEAVSDVPVGAVHSNAPAAKNAPLEK